MASEVQAMTWPAVGMLMGFGEGVDAVGFTTSAAIQTSEGPSTALCSARDGPRCGRGPGPPTGP